MGRMLFASGLMLVVLFLVWDVAHKPSSRPGENVIGITLILIIFLPAVAGLFYSGWRVHPRGIKDKLEDKLELLSNPNSKLRTRWGRAKTNLLLSIGSLLGAVLFNEIVPIAALCLIGFFVGIGSFISIMTSGRDNPIGDIRHTCPYCGEIIDSWQLPDEGEAMNCPKCFRRILT